MHNIMQCSYVAKSYNPFSYTVADSLQHAYIHTTMHTKLCDRWSLFCVEKP